MLSLLKEKIREYDAIFLVFDRNVGYLADRIATAIPVRASLALDADESNKNFSTVETICRFLLENQADRDAFLLVVGGGSISDTAGFAAAIYKRGIRFGIVATTLLSMVDASIGGKTGVNLYSYKNIIGAFHMPEFSIPAVEALTTLPEREFRSGAAEMLKTFILKDEASYAKAVAALSGGKADLGELIAAAAEIKEKIVSRDPYEKGERRKLNLGHTFAHAIEWYERENGIANPLTHGEAVAIGVVQAARLTNEELAERFERDFAACGLPTELPYPIDDLLPAMENDKKNSDGQIRFVLVRDFGDIVI